MCNYFKMSKVKLWLLGYTLSVLPASKLPSKMEVLRYFYHFKTERSLSASESGKKVVESVIAIYERLRIKTVRKDSAIRGLKNLIAAYDKLKKNKSNEKKASHFLNEVKCPFDISCQKEGTRNYPLQDETT